MIHRVEAVGYQCLRDVRQELGRFQILLGPNASGKSTFLDVLQLLGDLLRSGVQKAIHDRAPSLRDLVWMHEERPVELAVELEIPGERRRRLENGYRRARYEVAIGHGAGGALAVVGETLWLRPDEDRRQGSRRPRGHFPAPRSPRSTLRHTGRTPAGWKKVVTKKVESGNDHFFSETTGWNNPFRLGPEKLALANLPEDEDRFPVATWVKRVLMEGVRRLVLNSEAMRRPSPPGSPADFQPDGSNLPWAVEALRAENPARFEEWVAHVRTAFPEIEAIDTVEREEDRHRYLRLRHRTGLQAPSWTVSDGTLRLLALTLVAFVDAPDRLYLVEEPENGIHPQAVESLYQAFQATYETQILCASHSPVMLSLARPEEILCFGRTDEGATDVVRGNDHPALRDWRSESDLGTLFAAGVLG